LEALEEEEDIELLEEIIPRKKGHDVNIEVTSSNIHGSMEGQELEPIRLHLLPSP
jgi:hypothetical protein